MVTFHETFLYFYNKCVNDWLISGSTSGYNTQVNDMC